MSRLSMVSIGLQGFCTGTAPEAAELHRLFIKQKQGKAARIPLSKLEYAHGIYTT
jgi:hypothetical protein